MKSIRIISISLIIFFGMTASHAEELILGSEDDFNSFDESDLEGTGFDLPEFGNNLVPVVLTATRIQQHQSDVPASVTILDSEFIQKLGTNNLAEVLRYVPGIMMGPDKNNNIDSLNYHGGESSLPKNLQVLVDGRSMYRAGLASVSWYEMPVAIADIDRIEVVRGPNSASYGANAYQAVINILTKHPSDTYGTSISYEAGEYGQSDVFLRQGGRISETDYRISYTEKKHDGYDSVRDSRKSQFINAETYKHLGEAGELELSFVLSDAKRYLDNQDYQVNDNNMSEKRTEIGARWTKDFNSKHQLSIKSYVTYFEQKQRIQVAGVPVFLLDDNLSELNSLSPELASGTEEGSAAFNYKVKAYDKCEGDGACEANALAAFGSYYYGLSDESKNEIGLANIYFVAMTLGDQSLLDDYLAALNTSTEEDDLVVDFLSTYYPNTSTNPLDGVSGVIDAGLDEFRFDIELQDTYIYSPALTFVSGVSFRRDVVDSDHYFDGERYSNTARTFGSITWKPNEKTNLHLGGMIEKEEFSDSVFSPRAAINYKVSPSESVRYVYSESVRSPDFFEQFAIWNLEVENATSSSSLNGNTFYQVGRGPGMIKHQTIVSNEVGYYGRLNDYALELDVRIFHEEESNVLYQSLKVEDLSADNDNTIDHTGIEWQIQINPRADTLLRMTAAYVELDTSREDNGAKLRIYAKETATATWMQGWANQISTTLNYFIVKDLDDTNENSERTRIERIDGRIAKGLNFASVDADIYMNFQHDISSDPYLWDTTYYTDSTRLVFGTSVDF